MALEINHSTSAQPQAQPDFVYGGIVCYESVNGPYYPTYEGFENTGSSDVRWDHWNLDPNMKISRTASDFYLLYDLFIDELDEGLFDQLMEYVLPQFVRYTDMAVGGELRHARHRVRRVSGIPAPLRLAVKWTQPANKPQFGFSNDRHTTWKQWKYFRRQFGNTALLWAEKTFVLFTGGGYGGPRWANIAKTLRRYVTGEYTPVMFIDTCWGLQHNGGSYFNKAWTTTGIANILDANQREDFVRLCHYASPAIAEMYTRIRGIQIQL